MPLVLYKFGLQVWCCLGFFKSGWWSFCWLVLYCIRQTDLKSLIAYSSIAIGAIMTLRYWGGLILELEVEPTFLAPSR